MIIIPLKISIKYLKTFIKNDPRKIIKAKIASYTKLFQVNK
jgi:hypothetical protein